MKEHNIHINSIKISSNFSGQRIDNFLYVYFKKIPKSMIYRIIRTGQIRVNKKRIKFYYRLQTGDYLRLPIVSPEKTNILNIQNILKKVEFLKNVIIYEDDFFLALNKPSGIAVHKGSGLDFGIIEGLRILRPDIQFLALVHRLDRATSGVLLLAKNRDFLIYLHEQWRLKKIKKKYLALVYGSWDINLQKISLPVFRGNILFKNAVTSDVKEEKLAVTHFYIKERFDNKATLLIIHPITGKKHQIRVHTKYVGHPIIGDKIYGNRKSNIEFKKYGLNRLFLHAYILSFYHPNTKKIFCIHAPIDHELNSCLYYLRRI